MHSPPNLSTVGRPARVLSLIHSGRASQTKHHATNCSDPEFLPIRLNINLNCPWFRSSQFDPSSVHHEQFSACQAGHKGSRSQSSQRVSPSDDCSIAKRRPREQCATTPISQASLKIEGHSLIPQKFLRYLKLKPKATAPGKPFGAV